MEYASTAHNKRLALPAGQARLQGFTAARSVGRFAPSFPRLRSPTFPAARLAAGNVANLERYVQVF